jgi:hypothetical protein
MTALTVTECQVNAQACRDMARRETHPETRMKLENLAASWDQLCEELSELAKRKQD